MVLASAGEVSDVAGVLLAPAAGLSELHVWAAHRDKVGPQPADSQLTHAGQEPGHRGPEQEDFEIEICVD